MAITKRIGIIQGEIASDPKYTGTAQEVADLFNVANINQNLASMTGSQVALHIDDAEYAALSDAKQRKVLALAGIDELDPFGFAVTVLKAIFPVGGATLLALGAARKKIISRGVDLELGEVFAADIEDARR